MKDHDGNYRTYSALRISCIFEYAMAFANSGGKDKTYADLILEEVKLLNKMGYCPDLIMKIVTLANECAVHMVLDHADNIECWLRNKSIENAIAKQTKPETN